MSRTLAQARRDNAQLKCSARRCPRPRHWRGLSTHCVVHRNRLKRYGHPDGRPLKREEVAPYRALVADFLRRHEQHPAVVAAVGFMEQLLRGSFRVPQSAYSAPGSARAADPRAALKEHLQRLRNRRLARRRGGQLTGRELLERVVAVWLLSWRDREALPDDREALTFALGRALLRARPMRCRFMGTDKKGRRRHAQRELRPTLVRAAGLMLREGLTPFVANLFAALDREEKSAAAARVVASS